eukprot:2224485-Ditylum_brightwellii.AAC.1
MQGNARQTKAETLLSAKDNNDSTFSFSNNMDETLRNIRKQDSAKFALRFPSMRSSGNEHEQKIMARCTRGSAPKYNKRIQGFTMNKLRFHSVGLLGRKEEIKTICACLGRAMQPEKQTKEVVMISGYSGTGKSSLAFNLKEIVNSAKGLGAFVTGKFGQYQSGEPLSAISQAFGELCHKILSSNANKKDGSSLCDEIEEALLSELQNEVSLLITIIPDLAEIITSKNPPTKTSNKTTSGARQTGMNYALRVFTRVMSSYFSPLVLFFDDLQWADVLSLEIIELLILDS